MRRIKPRRLSRLAAHYRDTAVTVAGSFAVQLAVLVSGVLVARILGVENRGRIALLSLFALVIAQLGTLGLPLALTYWIARDPAVQRPLVASLRRVFLWQVAVSTATQFVVVYVVVGVGTRAFWIAGLLSLVAMPSLLAYQYALSVLQALRRFRAFSCIRLLAPSLYSIGLVVVAITAGGDLVLVTAIWVSSTVVAGASGLFVALAPPPPSLPPATESAPPGIRSLLSFGMRGLLGAISPLDSFQLDQAIVGLFISPAALGVYVVGVAFTNLPRFAAQSIGFVAYPHIAGQREPAAVRREAWRFVGLTLLVCGPIVGILEVALPRLVPVLFGPEFASAIGVARILLLSSLLVGLRRVMADCARGAGDPTLGTAAEAAATLSLPVGAALLLGDGVRGISWALFASAAVGLGVLIVGFIFLPGSRLRRKGLPPPVRPSPLIATVDADPITGTLFEGHDVEQTEGR